ncbi:ABC transporter substrate-binding protein [Thermomonospora umbrina]|uniref:Peptide/nickel transport system substrate-binding protein n=1 Tax=Thermomonospora umbrina TaxID=111806 RepID=A0A3D9T1Y1_9ACTN|nr:ABC transporter substrate-binding protein [Thermomonospora umbrina]REE97841.1 peptide/nickel transport system substrate-binding protein [Thermomonospora umbrina]
MKKTARAAATVAACVTAATVLAGCSGSGSAGSGSTTLSIATLTLPQSLDPADANGSALPFFQAVYDTLLKREPDGTYAPMLATAWKYNDDRTELALTLRGDVKFDDGTPFDAAAVKANMERFVKKTGAQAKTLKDVESIEVVDAAHVTLKLGRPNPAMLFYLSDAAGLMANPAAFAKSGDPLKTRPDGTGPYELDTGKTAIGTRWAFRRATSYWGRGLPYENVTINYFDNETALVNGIKTGQVNAAVLQDADQQAGVENAPKVTTVKQEFDFQGLLLFDRGGVVTPALRDTRVRQAINHAIDRRTMLDKLRQGRGQITNQIFGTDTAAYKKELDAYYAHDPAKARELLKQAGFGGGFTLRLPRITAIVPDALASSLQTDLGKVGIKVTWQTIDPGSIRQVFGQRAYSAMVMNLGQSATDWVTVGDYVTPGVFNMFGYSDATVKELLPKIQRAPVEEAGPHLQALNEHLVKDAWFVPFYRMTYLHVSDGSVKITPQSGMAVPSLYNYAPAK